MCKKLIFLVALMMGLLIYVVCSSTGVVVASHEWKNVTVNDAVANGLAPQTILLLKVADSKIDVDVGAVQNGKIEAIEVAKYSLGSEEPMAIAWQNVEKMAIAPQEACVTETAIMALKIKMKTDVKVVKKVIRDEVDIAGIIWATVANDQRAPSTSAYEFSVLHLRT